MANVALGRMVLEASVNYAEQLTDGESEAYSGRDGDGFAYFRWPGVVTVDLEAIQAVSVIRFLLWDGMGVGGNSPSSRVYCYRLLTSEDGESWHVHYDTGPDGQIGWQVFDYDPTLLARYIRIHGQWNSKNSRFHVVQLEVHDSDPPPLTRSPHLSRTITKSMSQEIGSGRPLAAQLHDTLGQLEQFLDDQPALNKDHFEGILGQLRSRGADIARLEASVDSVRRAIVEPVEREIGRSNRIGRRSVILGFIGGVLAIVALVVQLWSLLGLDR